MFTRLLGWCRSSVWTCLVTCKLCAGITRERLESFDRPIKVEPQDYPDKREALIKEFRNYLGILKVLPTRS